MSKDKSGLNIKSQLAQASAYLPRLQRYSFVAFLCIVSLIYGFVMFRINSLRNIEPSESIVMEQVKAAQIPKVEESVVRQLESLQDNSVSVQTLFDEARSNPFQ